MAGTYRLGCLPVAASGHAMTRSAELLSSLARVVPRPEPEPEPEKAHDEFDAILRAIESASRPHVTVPPAHIEVEPVDLTPLLDAIRDSRFDPSTLVRVFADALGEVVEQNKANAEAMREVVKEVAALRKKFNGVVAGGGGGGATEISLRAGADRMPADATNPLPTFVGVPQLAVYATYPTATTELYTYKNLDGVTVGTMTVTYTNATKDVLVSAVPTVVTP